MSGAPSKLPARVKKTTTEAPAKLPPSRVSAKAGRPPRQPLVVTLGASGLAAMGLVFLLMFAWGGAVTYVLLFGDKLSVQLIEQQTRLQETYEDTIAALHAQVELLNLEVERAATTARVEAAPANSIEGILAEMASRQTKLEQRHTALERLVGFAQSQSDSGGAVPGDPTTPEAAPTPVPVPVPRPRSGSLAPDTIPAGRFGLHLPQRTDATPIALRDRPGAAEALANHPQARELEALDRRVDQLETAQTRFLNAIVRRAAFRVRELNSGFAELGLDPARFATGRSRAERALQFRLSATESPPFVDAVERFRQSIIYADRLRPAVTALPVHRPMAVEFGLSSRFGMRHHPILGIARLHAGLDFRAPTGAAILAPGSGVVQRVTVDRGYGNLVEVNHGFGVITRYAHLSAVLVQAGQPVSKGTLIGRVGTTGLSTGPHLHYETRLDGEPIDPLRFMRAGNKLFGTQLGSEAGLDEWND